MSNTDQIPPANVQASSNRVPPLATGSVAAALLDDLDVAYRELDAMVVHAMMTADDSERLLKTGLLDPALRVLWHGRAKRKWKGGTLSVFDAIQARGISPLNAQDVPR